MPRSISPLPLAPWIQSGPARVSGPDTPEKAHPSPSRTNEPSDHFVRCDSEQRSSSLERSRDLAIAATPATPDTSGHLEQSGRAAQPSWTKPLSVAWSASAQFFGIKNQEQKHLWRHLSHLMDEAELSQRRGQFELALVLYESIEQACLSHHLQVQELMFGEQGDFCAGSPLHLALGGSDNGSLVIGLMEMAARYVDHDSPLTFWSLFTDDEWPQSLDGHVMIENRREAWLKRQGVTARRALEAGRDNEVSRRLMEMATIDALRIHRRHYLRHRMRTEPLKHVGLGLKPWHIAERHGCQNTLLMLGSIDPKNHHRFIMQKTPMQLPEGLSSSAVRWSFTSTEV